MAPVAVQTNFGAAAPTKATIAPIGDADCERVGAFLHEHLNQRLSARDWADAMTPTWSGRSPNHGFMLTSSNAVVGAQLAFYSERVIAGNVEPLCNLAALCVREDFRAHSLMLLKAALSQPGYSFTDFSPSGNVRPLNRRLGFQELDTSTALVVNLPSWPGRTRIVDAPDKIEGLLKGADLKIYRDHRDARAAHHVVLIRDGTYCYVMFRRDRRKSLPLFATVLFVSDPASFRRSASDFFSYLLLRHAIPLTLAELRVIKFRPPLSAFLASNRVKMFSSQHLAPETIDYLNSELTCVAW